MTLMIPVSSLTMKGDDDANQLALASRGDDPLRYSMATGKG
jgi:hypothetical protein